MQWSIRLVRSLVHPALFTVALLVPIAGLLIAAGPHPGAKAPASTGRVWVVGGPGGIPTIQRAVNSAADGDAILVKSGSYPAFSIVNKDLRVVADEGATVMVTGHVRVDQLAADKTVLLSGLTIELHTGPNSGPAAVTASHDLGHLRIQQCTIHGFFPGNGGYGVAGADFESSTDVGLSSCTVYAGDQPPFGAEGPDAIAADSSTVAIYDSTLRGGMGGYGDCGCCWQPGGTGGRGGAAFEQTETNPSFVFLSGSTLVGGTGGVGGFIMCDCSSPGSGGGNGGDGGPCIEQIGASTNPVSVGTLSLALNPGPGGPGGDGNGGFCGGGPNGAPGHNGVPFLVPAQQLQQLSGSSRKFLTPRTARSNATATLSCYGVPGDTYFVFLSPALEFTYLPNLHGVRLAQLPQAQLLVSGTVPSNGLFAPTIPLPPLQTESKPLYLQAYVRDASGSRFLCSQMTLLELDPSF